MPTTIDVFTVEEFERIAATLEDAELVAGRIAPVTPSTTLPAFVVSRLVQRLGSHVDAKGLGMVLGPDGGYVTDPLLATVRAPDVRFVSAARVPHPLPRGFAGLAPDFAIELYMDSPTPIASPSSCPTSRSWRARARLDPRSRGPYTRDAHRWKHRAIRRQQSRRRGPVAEGVCGEACGPDPYVDVAA